MATKKTSMFTLTERLTLSAAGTVTSAIIDLGSYVDVGDRQALQVHSVDFIYQGTDPAGNILSALGGNSALQCQVTDLNRGGLVFCNDRALVASGVLLYEQNGSMSNTTDLYPDNYGKGSDDGRFVVNDALYISGRTTALAAGQEINITVRVNASIVTLSQKDFMAIAIQSTAADN